MKHKINSNRLPSVRIWLQRLPDSSAKPGNMIFWKNVSKNKISKILNVSEASVSRVIKRFNETGRNSSDSKGGDKRSKLMDQHRNFIVDMVNENCLVTLKKMSEALMGTFSI